jgi:hypothetical protein
MARASYYTEYRNRRITMGLCSKCKNKLFKAGLCRKHYKINRNRTRNNRKVSRYNRCGICNEFRHTKNTCPYLLAVKKKYRHRFLPWNGPQTKSWKSEPHVISERGAPEVSMPKIEIIKTAIRWNKKHEPEDFELLYKAFHPMIINVVSKYQPELHYRELAPHAFASLLKAIQTYDYTKIKPDLYAWTLMIVRAAVHRLAGSLIYPGVPESQRTVAREESK